MRAFENAENLTNANIRRISITEAAWEQEPTLFTKEAYHILLARLFGMDYVSFLKYAANKYGATIVNNRIPYPLFRDSSKCDELVNELNRRWEIVCKWRKEYNEEKR